MFVFITMCNSTDHAAMTWAHPGGVEALAVAAPVSLQDRQPPLDVRTRQLLGLSYPL